MFYDAFGFCINTNAKIVIFQKKTKLFEKILIVLASPPLRSAAGGPGPNRGAAGADNSGLDFLDTFLSRKKYH